jgi:hypothetical protein
VGNQLHASAASSLEKLTPVPLDKWQMGTKIDQEATGESEFPVFARNQTLISRLQLLVYLLRAMNSPCSYDQVRCVDNDVTRLWRI